MKKNEIALILVIVGIVVMATYAILNSIMGESSLKPVMVDTTEVISGSIDNPPNPEVFNKDAINPAVIVNIGEQSNQQPFTIQN